MITVTNVPQKTLVIRGKLIFIKDKERKTCDGLVRCIKDYTNPNDPNDYVEIGDISYANHVQYDICDHWEPVQPIIISLRQCISNNDMCCEINEEGMTAIPFDYENHNNNLKYKLLALPEDFTKDHLSMISKKCFKDYEPVSISCEEIDSEEIATNPDEIHFTLLAEGNFAVKSPLVFRKGV